MLLEYAGPGPIPDGQGGLLRPGELVEWDAEPAWGPWKVVPKPEKGEDPPEPSRSMSVTDPGPHDAALSAPGPPAGTGGTPPPGPGAGSGAPASTPPGDDTEGN